MKHDMEKIREALNVLSRPMWFYFNLSAVPERAVMESAIDELEALRAEKEADAEFVRRLTEYLSPMGYVGGPILLFIGALRTRLDELRAEVAKKDARIAELDGRWNAILGKP